MAYQLTLVSRCAGRVIPRSLGSLAGDYWFAAIQLDSVRKPPTEFRSSALDECRGPVFQIRTLSNKLSAPDWRQSATNSCHVRYTRDTSCHSGAQHVGARAGSRTLNLGIKRRLTFLARKRQDVPGRDSRIRWSDPFVSQSVLTCHRLPRLSCQISCQGVDRFRYESSGTVCPRRLNIQCGH
jgi:hypothetical protein